MDQFEKISISNFIWYLVPGLALIFFLLFPLLVLSPRVTKAFLNTLGPFGIIILGTILGFILDGLRLYRFRPKYSAIKDAFFQELKSTVAPDLDPYFIQSHINDLANNKKVTGLSLHHAIWIMLGDFTILTFFEAIFWVLYGSYLYTFPPSAYSLFDENVSRCTAIGICGAFAVLFFVIAFRFLQISMQDQNNTNKMFTNFAKQYRDEIKQLLNIASDH